MNIVPTNDYRIWYDPQYRGTRIKTKESEYFIPDNRMIKDLTSRSMADLEEFKVK